MGWAKELRAVGPRVAAGFTAVCFWNAACLLIMRLEDRVRFGFGQALPGPIESE